MKRARNNTFSWILWWLRLGLHHSLLVAFLGCGAEYERRFEKTGELLRYGSQFFTKVHPNPTAVQQTGVSIRLPLLIDGTARAEVEQPPFVTIPGLQFSYVKDVEPDGPRSGSVPVHLYVGVVDAETQQDTEIMNAISVNLANTFENVPAIWDQIELDTPERTSIACKHVSVSGVQSFLIAKPYQETKPEDVPGRFDVYLYSTEAKHILTAWRCPDDIAESTQWFDLAGVSTGTIQIAPPSEE